MVSIGVALLDATVIAGGFRKNTITDNYHNLVVVSLLIYLVPLTALPVVLARGTAAELLALIFFGFVFAVTLIYDWISGRLQQAAWLKKNGWVTQV